MENQGPCTHFSECWRYPRHWRCAVRLIEELTRVLRAILEEAETDLDRDVIITECRAALARVKGVDQDAVSNIS